MEEKTLIDIRLASQQLVNPNFNSPKELVSWMGAIQAQDYSMAKWAIGLRLQTANAAIVNEALNRGEILRLHIMRPTWHFVAAENIRWMQKLSARHLKSANDTLGKSLGMTEDMYARSNALLEKILEGHKHLTRQEIGEELNRQGLPMDNHRMTRFMMRAEIEGIICNGIDRENQTTYALLEERVPPVPELHVEEALAKLATLYFRSHSPASLKDFIWWSGLSIREAKQAVASIAPELTKEHFSSQEFFIHQSCQATRYEETLHFMPSFDEYLISYTNRTLVLKTEHYDKAFNRFGIFHPIVMHNGKVVGNWNRAIVKRTGKLSSPTFFEKVDIQETTLKAAHDRCLSFIAR